ncbi:hypothetical protein C7120_02150 [Prevotella sp. oral taxon 376]|uniref:hypothetical protein n=1 Tax=Prevotella sp. oral taxon 376 TaxID=712466 RepID=UPI000D1DBBA7|nr:hypothetical protein [Prevotella sp. oral taxon 376]PTL33443.1 hypothetical protein C7120_02150 [Prevotella sp. oral taxon 376]
MAWINKFLVKLIPSINKQFFKQIEEINNLKTYISKLESKLTKTQTEYRVEIAQEIEELYSSKNQILDLTKQLDESIALAKGQKETILLMTKDLDKLEELENKVRKYESSYEIRSLKATNEFQREKISKLQSRIPLIERLHTRSYKEMDEFRNKFIDDLEKEILMYKRRVIELEQINSEILKKLQVLEKENFNKFNPK